MVRYLTWMAILVCGVSLAPPSGFAQSDRQAAPEPGTSQSRQLTTTPRDEPAAAVPVTPPPAAAAPVAPAPIIVAPAAPPLAATAPVTPPPAIVAPVTPPPPPVAAVPPPAAVAPVAILCDGGTATGSTCSCPSGYALLPATSGGGGTCVRSNAENCRGGVQTVTGICLCDGRVTMSGEVYALEFVGGKCIPKRCADKSYLKDGKCVASNDTRFSYTCRTGYIPDEQAPPTAATGLRCVPDPTFCPAEAKRKDGTCTKTSAIAIDCFEGRCSCGPNADWVNYLCQCTPPYRNVNGACVTTAADTGEKSKPELQSSEPSQKQKACGRGTVRSRSGNCVVARPRLPGAGELGVYYERAQRYYPPRPDRLPY